MTREIQKRTERAILDLYIEMRGIAGAGVRPGPEPPDFLLKHGDELIGIEITEYHDPSPTISGYPRRVVEATWEALRQQVVAYREEHRELDGLSVMLDFRSLNVPPRRSHHAFIEAVAAVIAAAKDRITDHQVAISVTADHPQLLRDYLQRISVRRVSCYMEWDWNHMFAGIGTSEPELWANIGPKLTYRAPEGVTSSRLIVAGGFRHSEIVAAWSTEQLNHFAQLNAYLHAGPFDEVAIVCMRPFLWTRETGWQDFGPRGG